MASDVEDLTTFYADFPSIFENNCSCPIQPSYDVIVTDVNRNKSYQPMFGSFLFADSDSLNRAAFVVSSSPSIDERTTQEPLMTDSAENHLSSTIQTAHPSSVSDDDIDEDDFDRIPIRHASLTKTASLITDHDLEDESFLNGFTDEEHDTTALGPVLFNDIPDIDDLNEHDEDERVPFDHMDMFDQSDSIRSSSPDSLLSSSHLHDDDTDDEVAQWNDDTVLHTNTNSQVNLPLTLNLDPADQVNFIDSSRSNSRCSDISSHLSIGYADQAHVFMSDDELGTSSESEPDQAMEVASETFLGDDDDNDEELCLQVNLDDHQSSYSSDQSNSTRSSSPTADETPIVDMDQDNPPESETPHTAPIAALDDDDDDDDDMEASLSDQPVLPTFSPLHIEPSVHYKSKQRQNDIALDIIHMRHILEENEHDDEFLAIMHNPSIFEQVLSDYDDQKKSELVKQGNSLTGTFRPSSQLSFDNEIKNESLDHHQYMHQASSLLHSSDNEKISSLSSTSTREERTTTAMNNVSPALVNHLTEDEGKEKDAAAATNVVNTTDTPSRKQKAEHLHCQQTNTRDIHVKQPTNGKEHSPTMSVDTNSDDDLELLQTLSQLHNLIDPSQSSERINQAEVPLSSDSLGINQEEHFSHFSSANVATNANETELLNKKMQPQSLFISSSPSSSSKHISDKIKNSAEEQEENDAKKNVIFYQNHNDEDDGETKQKEKYEKREERKEEKTPATLSSLTSPTSPTSFIDDSRLFLDPETSSLLPNSPLISSNQLNHTSASVNASSTDRSQIANTKSNMNNSHNHHLSQQTTTTTNLFDPFAPTTTTTNIFDDIMIDSSATDGNNPFSTQPLANFNFDDLWNQSVSHIDSTKKDSELSASAWDEFLNNTHESTVPTSNFTWETLFDEIPEEKNDLTDFLHWIINHLDDDHQPIHSSGTLPFMSIHNLESIIQDIQMCDKPFTPIPSPPLHVDHTVANPLINAMHHDLFPIDELEQPNISQTQASMILYEEDEEEEEEENDERTFDDRVQPVVEQLIETTLQSALTEINQSYYNQIEHFVDQILADAILEVYNDTHNLSSSPPNDILPTDNLASIVTWHDQKTASKPSLDPFDQKFDSVWSRQFQTPDDEHFFEGPTPLDPWMTTTDAKNDADPMLFFNNTFESTELFPKHEQLPRREDDQAGILSDYVPKTLLASPSNRMKYTLTAPVLDDSGDDSSILEDYLTPSKNKSSTLTNVNVNDQPLNSQTSEPTKSSGTGDDEPWELEDSTEEKLIPIPSTTRLTSPFNDAEYSATETLVAKSSFFADSFIPPVTIEKRSNKNDDDDEDESSLRQQNNEDHDPTLTKSVRFDDNVQNIRATTPPTYDLEESGSSTTSDSEEIKVEDISAGFKRDVDPVDVKKTDVQMNNRLETIELRAPTANSELERKDGSTKDPTITNENIPLKSTNTDTQLQSHPRSNQSALLPSTSKDDPIVETGDAQEVISCLIDNNPVIIDAKTIAPFRNVISSAGALHEDNQTAVIAIYGCWLPDHRLREYRYIMDQLFYYVYHQLEQLVTNDYILIYFHGATPKHRTPDLKFLRKCYQMVNFRLRKNLREVYVVHPTRWLRTVIALSRPFFSKKFYHKINYLYTVAELERQFPHNRLSIPVPIEQTDWLYSQKYDRHNASINRSIAQSLSQPMVPTEGESVV